MSLTSFEEKSQTQIDAVINQLAGTNSSLAACSLVSRRWHERCRQQSFRRARLADLDDLRSSGWSPSLDDVHRGNCSSDHRARCSELLVSLSVPQHLSHFKPLNHICSLTLDQVSITLFDFPTLQHTFRDIIPTVSNLRLLYPSATPSSLLQFIATFRNLQVVMVHAPSWIKPGQDTTTAQSSQLHGALCLSELDDASNPFLSLLGLHASGTKKVTISKCNFRDPRPLQKFLSSAGRSIQNLQIIADRSEEIPEISLPDCSALEQVFLSVFDSIVSFHRISSLISSIASPHFRILTLKLRSTVEGGRNAIQTALVDNISDLDAPLSNLGRIASPMNRKVSLVLLGQEPEFLAQGLVDFQKVGHVWAGEEVDEKNYFWTFTSPKSCKTKRYRICNLGRLLRRKN